MYILLFKLCENLCQYDKAQRLYELLYEECRQYIEIQFELLAKLVYISYLL